MTGRGWRCCRMLKTEAAVLLVLAGLTAANHTHNASAVTGASHTETVENSIVFNPSGGAGRHSAANHTETAENSNIVSPSGGVERFNVANHTEAVEKSNSIRPPGDAERDRRQVYSTGQFDRAYSEVSTHLDSNIIVDGQPSFFRSQVFNSDNLDRVPGRPVFTVDTPLASWQPVLGNRPQSLSPIQIYSPSRTPAASQPFLGLASRSYPPVTPVPLHLQPLQTPSYRYGVPPPNPEARRCPYGTECLPLVSCAPCFHQVENQPQLFCSIFGGAVGVCCPGLPNKINLRQVFSEPVVKVPQLSLNMYDINEAGRLGAQALRQQDRLEEDLRERRVQVANYATPSFGHLQFFKTSPLAVKISRDAFVNSRATYLLMTRFDLTPLEAGFGLQQFDLSTTVLSETCPRDPVCQEKDRIYRTIDGSCNNLDHPMWGQARTGFQRLSLPHYSDGLSRPRRSVTGGELPSARLVSTSIVGDQDRPSPDLTLSVMQWGQFIDHDLTHTPISRLGNMSGVECCSNQGRSFVEPTLLHPSCLPIDIPANDPFFGASGRRCMNFVRSVLAPRANPCTLGFAEQMNQITHYLDGSNIYGSSDEEEQELRAFRGGLLRVQERNLLPPDNDAMECESLREGLPCFKAGDSRLNEQLNLAVIHTVWVRFHNRVARELARLNPHWSDEINYQETRRVVVAMYQHIVYNEWLPLVIGKDYMAENGLLPRREGYSRDYDSGLNAAIMNEFATVAFRFGHTLVQGMIQLVGKKGRLGDTLIIHEFFNNPRPIYRPGGMDELLRGLATQPIQQFDNFVTSSLTNRLFQTPSVPFGLDLVALNTQRARDHGVAPYNDLRAACGLPKAKQFEDLLDVIGPEVVQVFKQLYASVDDIDPFVAGISERPAPGALLGPTFRCIIGDQFTRLKRGDRFFYDLADKPATFPPEQLNSIRMMSWARVLCETGDMLGYVQPLAFRQPRGLNERVPCDSPGIPGLDLTPWLSLPMQY